MLKFSRLKQTERERERSDIEPAGEQQAKSQNVTSDCPWCPTFLLALISKERERTRGPVRVS